MCRFGLRRWWQTWSRVAGVAPAGMLEPLPAVAVSDPEPRLPWRIFAVPVVLALATATSPAIGDDRWTWSLNALAELGYDDNWGLTVDNPADGFRFRLTPDVFVRWETERALVEADVGVRLERYFDLPEDSGRVDRQDPFAAVRGRYLLPYGAITGRAAYLEEALVDSFFQDGASVSRRGSRKLTSLEGAWTHELTETSLIELAGTYEDSNYSERTLIDYTSYTARLGLRQALSERTDGFVTVNGRFYRPDEEGLAGLLSQEQDAYYLQLGVTQAISPTWSGVVSAGYGRIQNSRDDDLDNSENGWLAQLGLIYTGEYSRLSFGASRDLLPSGAGELAITNRVYVDASRQLEERWEAGLSAFWAEDSYPFESVLTNRVYTDSSRFEVSPRVSYTLTPSWRLGASYRYRWLDQDPARGTVGPDGGADSNAFFLTVTYVPERP